MSTIAQRVAAGAAFPDQADPDLWEWAMPLGFAFDWHEIYRMLGLDAAPAEYRDPGPRINPAGLYPHARKQSGRHG